MLGVRRRPSVRRQTYIDTVTYVVLLSATCCLLTCVHVFLIRCKMTTTSFIKTAFLIICKSTNENTIIINIFKLLSSYMFRHQMWHPQGDSSVNLLNYIITIAALVKINKIFKTLILSSVIKCILWHEVCMVAIYTVCALILLLCLSGA